MTDPVDEVNVIIPQFNLPEPVEIVYDSQTVPVAPLIIYPPGPVPYNSDQLLYPKIRPPFLQETILDFSKSPETSPSLELSFCPSKSLTRTR